ncbi:MAG: response regulator [Verrucomicrobiae bacterium]|nr:response regulator [Verrucomicrobiae bacterium]
MTPSGSKRIHGSHASHVSHWRRSLATRLAAAWAISLGAAVGLSSWFMHRDADQRLRDSLRQEIGQDASEIRVKLEAWVEGFEGDARSCAESPLVFEFLNKRNTDEEGRWRQLLEGEFRSMLTGKAAYVQMRLLSTNPGEEGQELVRIDRTESGPQATPRERLQSKADRSYFQDALALVPGEIYLSEINLNRDFGRITEPHIPTMRAAVKIGGAAEGAAILVINADMRPVFEEVRQLASPAANVRLFDSAANYLLHPDAGATFAADLGSGLRPDDEYPELKTADSVTEKGSWLRDGSSGGELALATRVDLMASPVRTITLLVSLPGEAWYPALRNSHQRALWATALAALAGIGVAFLVSLPFTSQLRRLSSALREFDASGVPEPLPEAGKDEVGMAIERFREMAGKVREQVEHLEASRREAEEANASKEEFLAVMSHEIRTPMNAVVGLIRALETNQPSAHQLPILASLRSSATNLMTLLNTALDYTRLREGVIDYTVDDFDAAGLVREVGQSFRPYSMAKQLELTVDAPEKLMVSGDAVRFRQIINNLVGNAVKFTDEGSVRVSVEHADGCLSCTVSDTGAGIASQDQAEIFKPFVSLKSGSHPAEPGSGLGLTVSKQLVEQQNGELTLESKIGQGTSFTVRLPYARATRVMPAAAGSSTKTQPAIQDKLRILYVEDVASNQQVMALTLEGTGTDLTCAGTGAEALEVLEQQSFDLILLDLQLPDMTGYELADALRVSHPSTPLIAVTAQSSDKAARRCLEVGMVAVVLKPFSAEELFGAISKHTRRSFEDELLSLHLDDPARSKALAATMAGEFRAAAETLASLQKIPAGEETIEKIRSLQHKLKTAVVRFGLVQLEAVLGQLTDSHQNHEERLQEAVRLMEATASDLEQWSRREP